MTNAHVIFSIRGKRVSVEFDRLQLRLGSIVYVKFSSDDEPVAFSTQDPKVGTPCAVHWIAPSEWYVELIERFEIPSELTQKIKQVAGDFISPSDIDAALNILANRIRPKHLYKTGELSRNPLSAINTVLDRLDLCSRLSHPAVERELFSHQRPLVVYLLLTCFDRLGQSPDWIDFSGWLQSHSHSTERADVASQATRASSTTEAAQIIFDGYLQRYGVKRAFIRFLHEILPSDCLNELLDSIHILKIINPPSLEELPEGNSAEKEGYLFNIRNNYTHKASGVPGVGESILPKLQPGWMIYDQEVRDDHWVTVSVRDWPAILDRSVRIGLAEYLHKVI